ncbi:restriction endonuclease subunit S [Cellulophaga baltica]|uniref:restriction endonuclease subunit S n=1 Tax=Cellulophaga baltica TaxID=76594 RepID=UPI002148ED25|nr:restriction endonuclease subunit S [Cellulophaga baltica]MCR1025463.1 restriction endonuclease subunit S [Cellulophaga baltica]
MELEMEKGFKQTEFGTIPNDWKEVNLGKSSVLKARIGWQGLTTAEYLKTGDYFLITGTDFKNGYIDWDNCVYVERIRYDQDKNIQIKVEDVLVTKDGTIGKVAYVDKLPMKTTLNSGVFVIRPINNFYNARYFYFVLRSRHFKEFLGKLTAGSTISHLYQKDFVHYSFPLPPTIAEQKAIATALSDVDDLISCLDALIAKKKAIKQGAMQQLLTPNESWETKTIKELAIYRRGSFPQPYGLSKWYDDINGMPFVQVVDVDKNNKLKPETKQKISLEGSKKSVFVEKGTIILTLQGSIGRICITQYDAYVDRTLLIFESISSDISKYFFMLSVWLKFQIEKENAPGGIIKTITKEALSKFEITYPEINEQNRIAQILSDMDQELEELATKKQKYEHIKQGMMQELLTGKIRLV